MTYINTKAAFLGLCLVVAMSTNAQRIDTTTKNADAELQYRKYMQKRSSNLTGGWLLLGIGVALAGGNFLMNSANGWNGPNKGEGMVEAGIVAAALSTPFFIMAGANKRKARLALKSEKLTSNFIYRQRAYPTLAICIDL